MPDECGLRSKMNELEHVNSVPDLAFQLAEIRSRLSTSAVGVWKKGRFQVTSVFRYKMASKFS